jgi:cytochrome c-type biogenesis protein CcmH
MPVMFWIIVSVMALAAAGLVAAPLLRSRAPTASRGALELEVYHHQLKELAGEEAQGLISGEEAVAARLEIERRMLRAAEAAASEPVESSGEPVATGTRRSASAKTMAVAVALALLTPAVGLGVYMLLGSPDLAPNRGETKVTGADEEHMDMRVLTAKLAERLAKAPEDLQGWMLLGRSYVTLGDYPRAVEAYRKAVALTGDRPAPMVLAEYAEVLVQADGGQVSGEAAGLFRQVLQILPTEPRSKFYLGLVKAQAGDLNGALQDWVALLKEAEPGAPWAGAVREQAQEAANMLKVDLASLLPAGTQNPSGREASSSALPRPGPAAADIAAAAAMPEQDRKQMIEGMVERLAERQENEDRDNVDGWLRLARAYSVLDRKGDALAALGQAVEADPARADALSAYAEALQAAGEADPVSPRFALTMERILLAAPEHNQALWFLGAYARQTGDTGKARDYWRKLQARLPVDSEEYHSVGAALEGLDKAGKN